MFNIFFVSFFAILILLVLFTLAKATFLVQQAEVVIIERLGKFHKVLDAGLHFVVPFIDRPKVVYWTFVEDFSERNKIYYRRYVKRLERIDLREAVYDFPKQHVITRDNVSMEINALLYYQITDPVSAVYEVLDLPQAIEKLSQTTLRSVVGSMDLDETLSSREKINEKLREILDEATDKWGVRVNRVELQEVNPPTDIRVAMEKQMRAERDKRALILEAEGKKRAAILNAEGVKEAKVTQAKGEAEARILLAKAEAEAIDVVKSAVPGADPLPYLIAINYIKALPEITKDKNGKLILLPFESSSLLGSLSTIKEIFTKTES